ncbi:thiopeptide-type bacteriocin biosynthesis domain-containing protein [Streptomyces sp. TLI_053]|uniref:thiopeptide-type bacteriocin biosynthesis protein n=1 Tax=Streptomyces sp. TLI_053 TaxID=1855352 RepID=UPI00087AA46E|nr:thiopeptide-type bacteriocin biosynthesis protein [Streptomyces sp. TLI_053]SDT82702.1 thiopeptide-type bacteriocin biosynthesis domain-containing protein [Streptomyces sp. TLI_053]
MTDTPTPDVLEKAVLAALAGTPLPTAAALAVLPLDAMVHALDLYRTAGLAALTDYTAEYGTWVQVYVHPASWPHAEQVLATHLGPYLYQAENSSAVKAWWYVRKHPCWRIRLHPGLATTTEALREEVGRRLDALRRAGVITAWWPGIYEPETAALGGPAGIATAHALFHADSRAVLIAAHRGWSVLGRPELSVLLSSHLLRAAGQEWSEQGDVWHRVARMRPGPPDRPAAGDRLVGQIGHLLAADTAALTAPGGRLEHTGTWASAFHIAGQTLATAAHRGELTRGLRALLAHLVVFHWNRLGIPAPVQAALARAARDHVLGR